jgi:hypothetical protein
MADLTSLRLPSSAASNRPCSKCWPSCRHDTSFLGRRTEAIPIRKEESPSSRTSSSFNGHSAWPPQNASNLVMIGEVEPFVDDQWQVESSRKYGGLFTVEKGMVR